MRMFVISILLISLTFTGCLMTSVFASRTADKMISMVTSLSDDNQSVSTNDIAEIRALWDSKRLLWELCLRETLYITAENSLSALEALTETSENADYISAKSQLINSLKVIKDTQGIGLESIF